MGKAIGALARRGRRDHRRLASDRPGARSSGPSPLSGLLGAAILGAAGATVGATAGDKMEKSATQGLPEDEIFVYEDALRQGRSVVIVPGGE